MFAHDLHVGLAGAAVVMFVLVGLEAGTRIFANRPPGRLAAATSTAAVIVVGMAAAGGLAMLVRGERPGEPLHFVYAVLAFIAVPVGDSLTQTGSPRRHATGRLITALVALAIVARLFATG